MANIPFNCFGVAFQLLALEPGHIFYKAHNYSLIIIAFIVIATFTVTGWGQRKAKKDTTTEQSKKEITKKDD